MSISSLRSGRAANVVNIETQRAAFLVAPGRIELRETPLPRPDTGQVVLRIERALVGGTDRKAFARGHPQIPMPGPFGHRYAGVVARLGPNAPAFVGWLGGGLSTIPCLDCTLVTGNSGHLCPDVMKEKVLGALRRPGVVDPVSVVRGKTCLPDRRTSAPNTRPCSNRSPVWFTPWNWSIGVGSSACWYSVWARWGYCSRSYCRTIRRPSASPRDGGPAGWSWRGSSALKRYTT